MITGHTAAQIRTAERPLIEAGVPLMARAAHAVTLEAVDMLRAATGRTTGRCVLLLVGPGSNGGDALLAGAELRRRGVGVRALLLADRWHEPGAQALREAGGRLHRWDSADDPEAFVRKLRPDLVIDGVLGSGGRPTLNLATATVLRAVQGCGVPVLAVDVPSGMDATTGEHDPATLTATRTLAIGSVSQGLLMPAGAALAGRIVPCRIGLEPHLPAPSVRRLEDADVRALWPAPGREATKYTRGVVGIAAGSEDFPGAAVLAVEAACRMGAGMVRLLAPAPVRAQVLTRRPEAVGADGRVQALCLGPGVPGEDPRLAHGIDRIRAGTPGVIDAGGIDALIARARATGAGEGMLPTSAVLTPHRGEAERLADALPAVHRRLEKEPATVSALALVRALAETTGATVLLKGPVTLVATPAGELFSQADAVPQLATAGAGDVLAGTIAALLAQGVDPASAAAAGALLHGRAAVLASRGGLLPLTALGVAEHLPAALGTILEPDPQADACGEPRRTPAAPAPRRSSR